MTCLRRSGGFWDCQKADYVWPFHRQDVWAEIVAAPWPIISVGMSATLELRRCLLTGRSSPRVDRSCRDQPACHRRTHQVKHDGFRFSRIGAGAGLKGSCRRGGARIAAAQKHPLMGETKHEPSRILRSLRSSASSSNRICRPGDRCRCSG